MLMYFCRNHRDYGPVAHLVERLPCTEEVAGSSPVRSTTSYVKDVVYEAREKHSAEIFA